MSEILFPGRERDIPPDILALVVERIMRRIEYDPFGGCWLWPGAIVPGDYGAIAVPGIVSRFRVHRLMYCHAIGPIDEGLLVLHTCDVRFCCNPAHLFQGTHAQNTADMVAKGRHGQVTHPGYSAGEGNGRARLTAADLPLIVARVASGETCGAVAETYGVNRSTISNVVRGRTWGAAA